VSLKALIAPIVVLLACALGADAGLHAHRTSARTSVTGHHDVNAQDGCCYDPHPTATAAPVAAGPMNRAAVTGSIVPALPDSCAVMTAGAVSYARCGSTWYRPQFAGVLVNYVVVDPPN
jgi:hypothetical protein